jgi:hypothetical protein
MRNSQMTIAAAAMVFLFIAASTALAIEPRLMPIGQAWAANSVNAVVFRGDPITTHGDRQYAAYYDADGHVVIATRTLDQPDWQPHRTALRGGIRDAHNSISIVADGDGFLHVSWDHHGHPLRYVRSTAPGAVEFTERMPMTGQRENRVTYPQFFRLHDGNLLFFFRDGGSGRGDLVLNHYDAASQSWTQLHNNLISGEGQRNAYWQATVDNHGTVHLSWNWREAPDVASNHDLCYARSEDGGRTWTRSDGTPYDLPITAATAEIALEIPQRHELINQTSMTTDEQDRPIIATYFRPPGTDVVQYFIIHHDGSAWNSVQVGKRSTPFSLSGGGSKQIPISRPQVLSSTRDGRTAVWMIFRDVERDMRVSLAHCPDLANPEWSVHDLTDFTVRYWEPAYDRIRWQRDGVLNLYVQLAGQGDAETLEDIPPQTAYVLEWAP